MGRSTTHSLDSGRGKEKSKVCSLTLLKEPRQLNIPKGSVWQRPSDGDGQDAAFEFFQGDVNRVRSVGANLKKYWRAHRNLKGSSSHYPSLLKPRDFRRTYRYFFFFRRVLILPSAWIHTARSSPWWRWRRLH